MPSGRTHDAITLILAAPTFALTYAATVNLPMSIAVAVSFIFGGFMFGPDLDTLSNQYARWGIFRLLWFPYRSVFKHRSRWSHGLIFGTPRRAYDRGFFGACRGGVYIGRRGSGRFSIYESVEANRRIYARLIRHKCFASRICGNVDRSRKSHICGHGEYLCENRTHHRISLIYLPVLACDNRKACRRTASETFLFFESAARSRSWSRESMVSTFAIGVRGLRARLWTIM
jgi:uncharacterized metal-binding protein